MSDVDRRRVRRSVEADRLSRCRGARILHRAGHLRMLEGQLAFAHIGEAEFVDQRVADGPGVAGIELLVAGPDICSEARNIGSRGLEVVERLKVRIVREVVVETEILVVR